MIGLFDHYTNAHGILAAYFFLGSSFYQFEVARLFQKIIGTFDIKSQYACRVLDVLKWGIIFLMAGLAIGTLLYGPRNITPWFEWALTTYSTVFFIIITFVEDYVNQVSDAEPIPTKETQDDVTLLSH